MNNTTLNAWDIVGIVFEVIGMISTVFMIVRAIWVFMVTKVEWYGNVQLKRLTINSDDDINDVKGPNGELLWPYRYTECEYGAYFLIIPTDVVIQKMEYVYYEYDYKKKGKSTREITREKPIYEFNNISPSRPLIIKVAIPEGAACFALKWKGMYGTEVEYRFSFNGRDGKIDSSGVLCKYGTRQKIRKVLGMI